MDNEKNIAEINKWLREVLNLDIKSNKDKVNTVIQTPWSLVLKIDYGNNSYYLKQVPPGLYIESCIMKCINQHVSNSYVPKILYENAKLNCFVMESCGESSFRAIFNGNLDSKLLINGLQLYINIQRSVESNINDFFDLGVPDWRIDKIPKLYVSFLEEREMLYGEGITDAELDKLINIVPKIESICNLLSKFNIKETLVNCDLNENNLIFNQKTRKISIVDWGECVISHPFFTIAGHLQSLARRYKLPLEGEALNIIRQQYLSNWVDCVDKEELDEIYKNVLKLSPIYSALALFRLQEVTNNKSKNMQNWFIKGVLQSLLDNS